MQYLQFRIWDKQQITAFIAIIISLVVATSMPVKAVTVQQTLIGATEGLKSSIDATLNATISALQQNEKDMANLKQNLDNAREQVTQAVLQTRDQINTYLQEAQDVEAKAQKLVEQATTALGVGVQTATTATITTAVNDIKGFVATGNEIVAQAQKLVDQGRQKLDELAKNAAQYSKEQLANLNKAINDQVTAAADIVNKVGNQVIAGSAIIGQSIQSAGAAATKQLQSAVATIQGFVDTGKAVVDQAGAQVAEATQQLQDKVQSDLQTIKNAVKVTANGSGVSASVDLGNGLVIYGGISVPPAVAAKLEENSKKMAATLTNLRKDLQAATDPAIIKAKVQEAVKQINDAAIASVYARTAKAVNSQVAVTDALQVSANALQVQINELQQCIKNSSTDAECSTLQTNENSADQGASLQEKITKIRTNIDTVRSFLSSSVSLVSLLKNDSYRGTVESLTAMTTMMSAISTLSGSLRNDMNNLSNAVNVGQSTTCQAATTCSAA